RVGFNLPLGEKLSFYPRATIGVESVHVDRFAPPADGTVESSERSVVDETSAGSFFILFAPLLFHPAPHFFVGAGPGVFHEFAKEGLATLDGERTTIFGRVVVGGWWGGPSEPAAPAAAADASAQAPKAPRHLAPRFGDGGTWAFSGELSAGVADSTYTGVRRRSSSSYSVTPAFDYFFADHVSFGFAAGVGHESDSTRGVLGAKSGTETTSFAGGLRFGVDVPLSPSFSFYPKVYANVRHSESTDASLDGQTTKYASNDLSVALHAPYLVHFASHAFAGFGPYIAQSLVNHREGSSGDDNLGTTIGASLLVGGWL
ncbi:MAG: hypothetical protein JWP87_5383, partial [Labilithrix sp.]|nr:hypothetical protein [Labilithrix sp.]